MTFPSTRRFFLKQSAFAAAGACLGSGQPVQHPALEMKIGQMVMAHFSGLTAGPDILQLIREYHLGGVLLFESNLAADSPKASLGQMVQDLQNASSTPLLVAIDQEGGAVNRLKPKYGFPQSYSAQYLGERNDLDFTEKAANTVAATLASLGINQNFAPVVDLYKNPANPVVGTTKRCFSSDPQRVAEHAAAFMRAHHNHHIITTLKHFPGHGSSTTDSHKGVTDVTTTWTDDELIPYQRLISKNLVESIMTAHIFNAHLDENYPASLSFNIITKLLRHTLGFNGVVFSDDLLMAAITNEYSLEESIQLAINAGNDLLMFTTITHHLIPRVIRIIKNHVENGNIPQNRIDESYTRIIELKKNLA